MKRIKELKKMRDSFFTNRDYKQLCNKVLKAYIINVIILRKKEFKICFKGKYIKPLKERILDYFKYYDDLIYIKFFFHSKYYDRFKKKSLYPNKPVHLKHLNNINELLLENILNSIDLTIKSEILGAINTEYIIAFKEIS